MVRRNPFEQTASSRLLAYWVSYRSFEAAWNRTYTISRQLSHLRFHQVFDLLDRGVGRFLDSAL